MAVPDPAVAASALGALGYFASNPEYGIGLLRGAARSTAPSQVSTPDDVVTRVAEGNYAGGRSPSPTRRTPRRSKGSPIEVSWPEPGAIAVYGPGGPRQGHQARAPPRSRFISYVASKKGQTQMAGLGLVPDPGRRARARRSRPTPRSSPRTGPSSPRRRTRCWRSTRRSSVGRRDSLPRLRGPRSCRPRCSWAAAAVTGGAAPARDDGADGLERGCRPVRRRSWARPGLGAAVTHSILLWLSPSPCSRCRSGPPSPSRSAGRTCRPARCCASGCCCRSLVPDFVLAYSWLRAYGRLRVHRRPARPGLVDDRGSGRGGRGRGGQRRTGGLPRRRRWAWPPAPSRPWSGRRARPVPAAFTLLRTITLPLLRPALASAARRSSSCSPSARSRSRRCWAPRPGSRP